MVAWRQILQSSSRNDGTKTANILTIPACAKQWRWTGLIAPSARAATPDCAAVSREALIARARPEHALCPQVMQEVRRGFSPHALESHAVWFVRPLALAERREQLVRERDQCVVLRSRDGPGVE